MGVLAFLSKNDANAAAIAAAGGAAPLEQLARDGEGTAKAWASGALARVRAVSGSAAGGGGARASEGGRVQAGVDEHARDARALHLLITATGEAMVDLVTDALGNTYERAAIEQWLQSHNTSPLTGATLPDKRLTPVNVLKSIIQEWEEEEHTVHGDGRGAEGEADLRAEATLKFTVYVGCGV